MDQHADGLCFPMNITRETYIEREKDESPNDRNDRGYVLIMDYI